MNQPTISDESSSYQQAKGEDFYFCIDVEWKKLSKNRH